jgi:hypothetical protein
VTGALLGLGIAFAALALARGPAAEAPPAGGAAPGVPEARTAAADLGGFGREHHEVLRIDQEGLHSNPAMEIVLDGWVDPPGTIAQVRLWWLHTGHADERRPFSRKVTRHIDVEYVRRGPARWTVRLARAKEVWRFEVELDDARRVRAYANVRTPEGTMVEHCRAQSSRMIPQRTLGMVSGIDRIDVECVDAQGQRHRGVIPTVARD